ncbi:MAG: hypothetical protein ACYTEP_04350 [Planctomycetota bacterium]
MKPLFGLLAASLLCAGSLTATPQYTPAQVDAVTNAPISLSSGLHNPNLAQPSQQALGGTAGVLSLSVTGSCPGTISIDVTNATPVGQVAVVRSGSAGSFTVPGGPCAGTVLGLNSPVLLVTLTADAVGDASVSGAAPAAACGAFLQAVDLSTCGTTTVEQVPAAAGIDFPSAGSTIVGSVGFIDAEQCGYYWSNSRGDGASETLAGPASITSYTLDVDLTSNVLSPGNFVTWQVTINGIAVDLLTSNPGDTTISTSASFPSIAGPNYDVALSVLNEVPGGGGSVALRYAGAGTHSITLN